MTSRTRRNVKTTPVPEAPKITSSDEEDTTKKDICEVGHRRSMRHSPGLSPNSPPRKTRKIRNSSESLESNQNNASASSHLNKGDKSPSHEDSNLTKEWISDEEGCSPLKLSLEATSNNHVQSTPCRSTHNNSVLPITSPKKKSNSPSKNFNLTPSRRSMRSKGGGCNPIDDPGDTIIMPSTSNELTDSTDDIKKELKHKECEVGCKRPLSDISDHESDVCEKTNGELTSTYEERKRIKLDISNPNGKLDHDDLNGSQPIPNSSNGTCFDSSNIGSNEEETVINSAKRKLDNPSCDESLVDLESSTPVSKRPKFGDTTNSNLETAFVGESISTNTIQTDALVSEVENSKEVVDMLDNSQLLLKDLDLSEIQVLDLQNLLPESIRDGDSLDIIEELVQQLLKCSSEIKSMSSPRFNKLLRQLLLKYCECNTTIEKKHKLCKDAHEWSKERKTVNLRHELELALMSLYFSTGFYRKAEEMATSLYNETKKLQDKEKTVRACLCLSKAFHAMGNISKARANITTAKTEALKIYTPPNLQAELDLQSGIMQVAEEKDMETAFSYFKEAATGSTEKPMRSRALKYMLLTKLLINRPEEGEKSVHYPVHIGDIDGGVEAMLGITKAAIACSLKDFKEAKEKSGNLLSEDLVVNGVLDQLYSKMLEKNLLAIVKPYERMQISVVAEKIHLPRDEVERRLSQMILDGGICAQLDHRDDCLYVYEPETKDNIYSDSVKSITQLDRTLSLLNKKVKKLLL